MKRFVIMCCVVVAGVGLAACGGAETGAAVATPTASPGGAFGDPDPPADCESQSYGASLAVTDLGDRRFRVDVRLRNMGLPAGRLHRLDATASQPIASFPESHGGPGFAPDAMVERADASGSTAEVILRVPAGESVQVYATVKAEAEFRQWHQGDCLRVWQFTTVETDVVTVG